MFQKILLAVFFLLLNGVFQPLYAAGPAMVEKDLFSVDRKPPPLNSKDASPGSVGQQMAIGNIELDGIMIRNNSKKALLRIKNIPMGSVDGTATPISPFIVIREGGTVQGYRVTKIKLRSISLQKDGRTYTIGLFADNKVAARRSTARVSPAASPAQVLPPGEGGRPPGLPPGFPPGVRFNPGKPPQMIPPLRQ